MQKSNRKTGRVLSLPEPTTVVDLDDRTSVVLRPESIRVVLAHKVVEISRKDESVCQFDRELIIPDVASARPSA